MLAQVKTPADYRLLPSYVRAAIEFRVDAGLRFQVNINRASRKKMIQVGVARAIREQEITLGLGVEILQTNKAYGPEGKKALAEFH